MNNQIIIYSSENGETKIEIKLENETLWLSQKQMAKLFGCSLRNIGIHLQNVFNEAELSENSVVKDYFITASDGKNYLTKHYNLDAIISVGYRVNSVQGTKFRIWATQKLKEYIIKGFIMDDDRLTDGRVARPYFVELEERIRKIRTSETNFYQKIRDIFATSVDYSPKLDYAKQFFAMVQNKFHYAITGLTAAEIVFNRIDNNDEYLGLANFKGEIITRDQAEVSKNYLEEIELKSLNLLVEQFLSYAERQVVKQRLMYMKNWVHELNEFLTFNREKILNNSGTVPRDDMEEKVRCELAKYNQKLLK
jgi:hypothetical protein